MMVQPLRCPCCKAMLYHCESCWNEYHNGLRDRDFIPPAYYGEPLFDLDTNSGNEMSKPIWSEVLEWMPIKPDKTRPYVEGSYNHSSTPLLSSTEEAIQL